MEATVRARGGHSIVAGSRERFTALYESHYDEILRYAWRRVGPDQAEDVVNETFTIAWRRLDDVTSPGELPWLYGVARNVIANRLRKDLRYRELAAASTVRVEPDHAETVSGQREALAVLADLSDRDRELVRLVAWEGLDARDAGLVLGCSRATVHVRLHRLRKRLEQVLDRPVPEGERL
jgi:RNA polymerase sigma-70 factor, ECF subfamily